MVVPTNEVWRQLYDAYTPCFEYDQTVADADSLAYTNSRLAIVKGTIFSRTLNPDAALVDSAYSTNAVHPLSRHYTWGAEVFHYYQYGDGLGYSQQKPLQPGGVLFGTQNVICSNGQVMKASADNWNFNPLNTFLRPVIIEAEGQGSIKSVSRKINSTTREVEDAVIPTTRVVSTENNFYGKVWSNSYVEFRQLYSQNDSATFNIRDVLSNVGYDIYLVMAPALANDSNATDIERAPVKMNTVIAYTEKDGTMKEQKLAQGLVTTPDQVDYLLVAEDYKFPVCTYGLSSTGDAKVTLRVETNVRPSEFNRGTYSRTLRIDCIMLIPHGMAVDSDDMFGIAAHGDGVVYTRRKK